MIFPVEKSGSCISSDIAIIDKKPERIYESLRVIKYRNRGGHLLSNKIVFCTICWKMFLVSGGFMSTNM